MRMDKLTSNFQQALADAQSLAVGRDHNMIEPVHVLTALLDQAGGSTRPLLAQAGVNVPVLRERLVEALDKLPKVSGQEGNLSIGNELNRLLNLTDKLAQQRGDAFIASEWFVLAALEDKGALAWPCAPSGPTRPGRGGDRKIRGGESVQSRMPRNNARRWRIHHRPDRARREGKLVRLFRAMKKSAALSRSCNAGPRTTRADRRPGVGKTAIVETRARIIINGEVPEG